VPPAIVYAVAPFVWGDCLVFLEIKGLLNAEEIARLTALAQQLEFVDGRITNRAHPGKDNLQIRGDVANPKHVESARIVAAAFPRCRKFCDFAFPKRTSIPTLTRYDPAMKYGAHADAALLPVPPNVILRADLSATVFITDPATYEGGELVVHLGTRSVAFKGGPGDAIVYPSTELHEVRPVTSGSRLVSLMWIESRIADQHRRTQLYELSQVAVLEGANMSWENRVRFEVALENLTRMWSDI
jgi:PKHD-type hydroxylase